MSTAFYFSCSVRSISILSEECRSAHRLTPFRFRRLQKLASFLLWERLSILCYRSSCLFLFPVSKDVYVRRISNHASLWGVYPHYKYVRESETVVFRCLQSGHSRIREFIPGASGFLQNFSFGVWRLLSRPFRLIGLLFL